MNNLLFILGLLAISNGNLSFPSSKPKNISEDRLLIDNTEAKNKFKDKKIKKLESKGNSKRGKRIRKIKKIKKVAEKSDLEQKISYNINDLKTGINLMDLSEDDLDRGMEIITRTKKYMSFEERKMLIKLESILDLIKGIKKLNQVDTLGIEDDSEFFRTMDEEDKKNMMIKEILEVFPEKKKESLEKAIDMKKKIDLFSELFLPDSDEEGGFSLGSLANISNLGSINNIKLLGSLLRGENLDENDENNSLCESNSNLNQ